MYRAAAWLQGWWVVVDYSRIRRRKSLLAAQGYLELADEPGHLGRLRAELRDRLAQRALEALDAAADSRASRLDYLYLKGLAYRTMHRYAEAIPPLEAAAELSPDKVPIWLALGWCYKRLGRLDKAIESLERALLADQREAIVHYNLACYWSLAGDAKRAVQFLAQSFDFDPQYRELVGGESDFDPIRNLPDFQALMRPVV